MRAKLISEHSFKRGQDPKKSMNIGKAKIDKEKMESIEWAFDPFFFNNRGTDSFEIEEFIEDYHGFPIIIFSLEGDNGGKVYRASSISDMDYSGECKSKELALKSIKKRIDDLIQKRPWMKKFNESQNFERGKDPKDSMTIGKKSLLKKIDAENDWGFEITHAFHREIWDIIEYRGFLIKITKVTGSDGIGYYLALNNIGETYHEMPTLYQTPDEALDWEKKFIDMYKMDM